MFLTFETDEKVVQINARELTRVEYELDRVVFHFAGGASRELLAPTAGQVQKLKKKLRGPVIPRKKRTKVKARAAKWLHGSAT